MYLLFERIPDWNWRMTARNAWKLFLSKTLPALMSRKADLAEGCTRLPELEERNNGAKLLPSPEYEAGLTGRIAGPMKSTLLSVVSGLEQCTTALVQFMTLSHALLALLPPKMKDSKTVNMRTTLFIFLMQE